MTAPGAKTASAEPRRRPGKPARNRRLRMDGWDLLSRLPNEQAALAVFDPQYRGILDKQRYGNEGKGRGIARAELAQMTEAQIDCWLAEIYRALRPSGHLFLWCDKFMIGEGRHVSLIAGARLRIVDLIVWNKGKIGMGKRSRATCEFVVVAQKSPVKASAWKDRSISDCWYEYPHRSLHTHQKPSRLLSRMICAVTSPGDLVVDPCAGSFRVLDICRAFGREFIGCDLRG